MLALVIFVLILFGALFFINRDIFIFEDAYTLNKVFTPERDEKHRYRLGPTITLKQGTYTLAITGDIGGSGNGFFIVSGEEYLVENEFKQREITESFPLIIEAPSSQIRLGISYEPNSGNLTINSFSINSDHVLTRDSFLRHLTLSICLIILAGLLYLRIFYSDIFFRWFGKVISRETEPVFLFLLLMTILTSFPLFVRDSYLTASDFKFHLSRIEGIKEGLEAGYFPVRINLFVLGDYGYGNGLYYPDILLYFPAILRILGFPIIAAYKIFAVILNFLTLVSMYFTVNRIAKSKYAGYISVILYAFASYRLTNFYYLCTLGVMQAFIFIPLIILGFYEIFYGNPKKWGYLALGFAGLAMTHLISLMIVGIASIVLVLFNLPKLFHDRRILTGLVKAVVTVLGISAFFFLPMIEQSVTHNTYADTMLAQSEGAFQYNSVLSFSGLLSIFSDWKPANPTLGYPLAVVPVLLFFVGKKRDNPEIKFATCLVLSGMIVSLMTTHLFPWQAFGWLLNRIQTSARLLVLATPLLVIGGSILLAAMMPVNHKNLFFSGFFLVNIIFAVPMFINLIANRTTYDKHFYLYSYHIGGGEYMPLNSNREFVEKNQSTVLSDNGKFEVLSFNRKDLSFTFDFRIDQYDNDSITFEIPLLYYKGYQAKLTKQNGETTSLPVFRGIHGFTAVDVRDITEGNLIVYYQETGIQILGNCISLFTILVLLFIQFRRKKDRSNKQCSVENLSVDSG